MRLWYAAHVAWGQSDTLISLHVPSGRGPIGFHFCALGCEHRA